MSNSNRRSINKEVGTLSVNYATLVELRDRIDKLIAEHGVDAWVELCSYPGSYPDEYIGVFVKTSKPTGR